MKKNHIKSTAFLLLFAFLTLSGCGSGKSDDEKAAPLVFDQKVVVQEVDIPDVASVTGTVRAVERVTLSSRVNGHIVKLLKREGDRVLKDELLVEIDTSIIEADLSNAKAALSGANSSLNNASKQYKRAQSLFEEKAIPKSLLDQRQSEYEQGRAAIEQMKANIQLIEVNLNFTKIYSPFDGVIIEKKIEEGELAGNGTPLLVLENLNELEVVAEVKESDLPFINPKLNVENGVEVRLDALSEAIPGTLTHIIPSGDPFSHTFKVMVRIGRNESVLSGMFARLNFQSNARKGILIPQNMVVTRGELTGVKILKDNAVSFRVVRTGAQFGDNIEILSGLNIGDEVVYAPY